MKDATSDIRASIDASHLINEMEYAVLARAQGLPGSAEKLSEAKHAIRAALSASPTSGETVAWMHEDDDRVVSTRQKTEMVNGGGASASVAKSYTIALVRGEPREQQALHALRELAETASVFWTLNNACAGAQTLRAALDRALSLIAGAGDGVKTDGGKSNG